MNLTTVKDSSAQEVVVLQISRVHETMYRISTSDSANVLYADWLALQTMTMSHLIDGLYGNIPNEF